MDITKERIVKKGDLSGKLWKLLAFPLLLFIAIPILSIFMRTSPIDFIRNLNERQVLQAVTLSLTTSTISTLLTLIFGTPVAYLLANRKFRGYTLVDSLVDIPTVLPPSVAGVALLMAFGRRGLLGAFLASRGITIPFTFMAVVMAQMFIASPFYIKAATIGFFRHQ